MDRHNLLEMDDMQAINEDILMRSQGFEGSFQDFLQSRGMSAEEFKPIFDVWDQEYLEAMDEEAPIIPGGADLEMVELKGGIDEPYKWREDMSYSELDDLAEDIFNTHFDQNVPFDANDLIAAEGGPAGQYALINRLNQKYADFLDQRGVRPPAGADVEMTELKQVDLGDTGGGDWKQGDEIRPFTEDIDPNEIMNGLRELDDFGVPLNQFTGISQTGDVAINWDMVEEWFTDNAMFTGGLFLMPGVSTIINLINMAAPGSSRWINRPNHARLHCERQPYRSCRHGNNGACK